MKEFPVYPAAADAASDLFERGHIWLHERVDGAPLRFQVRADGQLRFGDDVRVFSEVPPAYEHAVRHLRETVDRAALRDAVDDVESVVFFGVATHRTGVDYDWERLPSVLGVDVWSDAADAYLRPDRVAKVYSRLGLDPLNTVRAELRAADFDPGAYTFPASEWYDGPAAGVLVRDKTGHRARLDNADVGSDTATGDDAGAVDAEAVARQCATTERFEAVARQLRAAGRPVTFDTLYERTVETVVRAHHDRLFGGREEVDVRAFRSTVAERTQRFLASDRG
jgi:hypothetical protein